MYASTELFGRIQVSGTPLATAVGSLRRQPLNHLQAICSRKFPEGWDRLNQTKANSRERIYTPQATALAFLSQILNPGRSCREAVRQVQAAYALLPGAPAVGVDTSPYCRARARLEIDRLRTVNHHMASRMEAGVAQGTVPWSRPVKVVDGTCLNLPDTPENRAAFPQAAGQRRGCGFPIMRMVGMFSLQTGACLAHAEAAYRVGEGALFRQLWASMRPGDIALGDRLFEAYGNLAGLLQRGVDSVYRINAHRSADFRRGRALGRLDRLLTLPRPARPAAGWTRKEWKSLPGQITVRQIRARIQEPNCRVHTVTLITTLVDPDLWPSELIVEMYRRRWQVELFLDDIKTTLQMDRLSCQSPGMVLKEIEMHMVAYNLVRALMQEASIRHDVPLARISFKGTLDTVQQYSQAMTRIPARQSGKRRALYLQMLQTIAKDLLPVRPGRREPRCVKRRPKAYPFMTRPRRLMRDPPKSFRRTAKKSA